MDSEYVEKARCLERAEAIKAEKVIIINAESRTGSIESSDGSLYAVSLNSCNCADYGLHQSPCKHMIRLALELGYSFDVPKYDPYLAAGYDVQKDIDLLTEHWKNGELTLDAVSKCIAALKSSAKKARRPQGRPRKQIEAG